MLVLDADGTPTPNVDRNYMLNPWPELGGMHYDICQGAAFSGINSDSKGQGAIRYVDPAEGKRVRVDTHLIPLAEISRKVGDKIRLCYWGFSPKPALTVNSAGFERAGKKYEAYNIPLSKYCDYVLATESEMDVAKVPDGRTEISLSHRKNEVNAWNRFASGCGGSRRPVLHSLGVDRRKWPRSPFQGRLC